MAVKYPNIPVFNRKYIFTWSIFHGHASLPEGIQTVIPAGYPILPILVPSLSPLDDGFRNQKLKFLMIGEW